MNKPFETKPGKTEAARASTATPEGYMPGFGNGYETEALPGALPIGRNSPQRCAYGLYAEQLSGSPFTAPRASNERSWLYRIRPTVAHWGQFRKIDAGLWRTAPCAEVEIAPAPLRWDPIPLPDKPLSFLDHHLRVGNSLIGLGPNQTVTEIPDEAFTAVTGDDKKQAAELRKFNKKVRSGQMTLALGLTDADAQTHSHTLAAERRALDAMPEDTPAQISAKVAAFAASEAGGAHARLTAEADLWTAAFFWPIEKDTDPASAPTHAMLTDLRTGTPSLFTTSCMKAAAEICERVRAFHWPLAFPEIAAAGGFDVVLGNPPWERVKLQEQEFFPARDPEMTIAANADLAARLSSAIYR